MEITFLGLFQSDFGFNYITAVLAILALFEIEIATGRQCALSRPDNVLKSISKEGLTKK